VDPERLPVRFDPSFLLILPVFVLSVVVHETAHGLMALWCGDATARDRGRLTLNPLPHVDLVGSLVLPAVLFLVHSPVMFGWAKPVPVDHGRLRDPRNDSVKVALAGPAANALLAVVFAVAARLAPEPGPGALRTFFAPLADMAVAGVIWNCALALFNLIPIPPLDGSWVLMRFLRLRAVLLLSHYRILGIGLVMVLLSVPFTSHVLFEAPLRFLVHACLGLVGVSLQGGI
jgi:Zn-dependent protease